MLVSPNVGSKLGQLEVALALGNQCLRLLGNWVAEQLTAATFTLGWWWFRAKSRGREGNQSREALLDF